MIVISLIWLGFCVFVMALIYVVYDQRHEILQLRHSNEYLADKVDELWRKNVRLQSDSRQSSYEG